jgi:peroxiredoxin
MPELQPLPDVGSPAPDFHVVAHTGEPLSLATYRGVRPLVLYFMREFT